MEATDNKSDFEIILKAGPHFSVDQVRDLRDTIKLGDVIQASGVLEAKTTHILHPISITVLQRWRDLHPKHHFTPRCLRENPASLRSEKDGSNATTWPSTSRDAGEHVNASSEFLTEGTVPAARDPNTLLRGNIEEQNGDATGLQLLSSGEAATSPQVCRIP